MKQIFYKNNLNCLSHNKIKYLVLLSYILYYFNDLSLQFSELNLIFVLQNDLNNKFILAKKKKKFFYFNYNKSLLFLENKLYFYYFFHLFLSFSELLLIFVLQNGFNDEFLLPKKKKTIF